MSSPLKVVNQMSVGAVDVLGPVIGHGDGEPPRGLGQFLLLIPDRYCRCGGCDGLGEGDYGDEPFALRQCYFQPRHRIGRIKSRNCGVRAASIRPRDGPIGCLSAGRHRLAQPTLAPARMIVTAKQREEAHFADLPDAAFLDEAIVEDIHLPMRFALVGFTYMPNS